MDLDRCFCGQSCAWQLRQLHILNNPQPIGGFSKKLSRNRKQIIADFKFVFLYVKMIVVIYQVS